ncbi:MAG: hypothetical protein DRI86_02630 [Bacteroidetes bacterium]|nr:MAG: hypothetical protein DRI86_02630 [Bacteroidota bacterium]
MNMRNILYILLLSFILIGCISNTDEGKVVAVAYDNNLFESNLNGIVPNESTANDSAIMISVYINNWMREQSILHKANSSYVKSVEEKAIIDKRVEEYKNSLIIYNFERRFVAQYLDTIVQYAEIENFYSNNKKEFMLKDDIVQVAYLKFYSDEKNLKQVRALMRSYSSEDIVRIKSIADENAVNYLLEENTWILFDDLVKEIPLQTYNKSLYLKNNKYVEVKDSAFTYMLRVNEYRIRNNYSPISFEEDRIRRLIINIRKMQMVEKLHNDIFEEAQKDGKINIKN